MKIPPAMGLSLALLLTGAGCGPPPAVDWPSCASHGTVADCLACCESGLDQCQKGKQSEFLDCIIEQDRCIEQAYESPGAVLSGVPPDLHCHWKKCSPDSSELCPRCVDHSEDCDIDHGVCLKLCQGE